MAERSIIFSAPMVGALLRGSKTQTRRAFAIQFPSRFEGTTTMRGQVHALFENGDVRGRYGVPGDRLWVRETWGHLTGNGIRTVYRADGDPPAQLWPAGDRMVWRPSIFMRRCDSRITLEVTRVRVERLHAITEADARAEGLECDLHGAWSGGAPCGCLFARDGFRGFWDTINGDRAPWDANPFVWVVEFNRVVEP